MSLPTSHYAPSGRREDRPGDPSYANRTQCPSYQCAVRPEYRCVTLYFERRRVNFFETVTRTGCSHSACHAKGQPEKPAQWEKHRDDLAAYVAGIQRLAGVTPGAFRREQDGGLTESVLISVAGIARLPLE
jgi:hypothetical protein